jgi:hypothetical protein
LISDRKSRLLVVSSLAGEAAGIRIAAGFSAAESGAADSVSVCDKFCALVHFLRGWSRGLLTPSDKVAGV